MTAWTDFLKANAGKGYTRSELQEMYKKKAPVKKQASAKAPAKAPSKSKKVVKAKTKAPSKAKSVKKGKTVQTKLPVVLTSKKSRVIETEYGISIGDKVRVYKPYKSKELQRQAGIFWDSSDELRTSIKDTQKFIEDLNDAIDLVAIYNTPN